MPVRIPPLMKIRATHAIGLLLLPCQHPTERCECVMLLP